MKIGACSSPSRVAPGPILATLGIRSSLAPNLHYRRTCTETPACVSRTFGFLGSHRSSGAQSHDHLPHHAHSTSPELNVAGTFNLPTGDQGSVSGFQPGRIASRNSTYFGARASSPLFGLQGKTAGETPALRGATRPNSRAPIHHSFALPTPKSGHSRAFEQHMTGTLERRSAAF
jgi:hypothetical protein